MGVASRSRMLSKDRSIFFCFFCGLPGTKTATDRSLQTPTDEEEEL